MRRFGFAGLAFFLVFLAACSSDTITPSDGKLPGTVVTPPQAVGGVGCSADAEDIEAHLTALMNTLVPNDNSTLGKFQYVQTLMAYNDPDSTTKARAFAQDPLLSFIHLKFSQATPEEQAELADDVEQVEAEILCFVGLFQIPTSNSPKVVVTPNQLMGVWFPDGFCDDDCPGINVALDILTACTAPGVPEGCTPAPLGTLLDTYGNFLRVTLSGGTPDLTTPDSPVVGICAPSELGDISLLGLRVGHQDDGTSNTEGFTILDLVLLPPELDEALSCETFVPLASNDIPGAKPGTMFARMVNHLADFLLPQKASANRMLLGGFGIGGTTRTFSPFGLVSTTLTATGIGGTKSSFSPANPDAPASAPALTADPNATLVDSVFHKQFAQLPGVFVKTGQGTAIPGATVTFTMIDPVTAPYNATPSTASVCNGAGETQLDGIVVTTDANGFAALGCVNFGGTVGFRNLQATINPLTVDGVAGGGIDDVTVTACDPICGTPGSETSLNWLVQTTSGVAAKLTIETIATTAAAGTAFLPQPQPVLNVRDQFNNLVLTDDVVVSASATPPAGGTGGLINNSTPTSASGVVTFSNLGIGGTVGNWKVKFTAPSLQPDSANVTITAGAASSIQTFMPPATPTAALTFAYPGIVTAGAAVSPAPQAIVKDQYGNAVAGQVVSWTSVNSTVNDAGGSPTNGNGLAQVTSWTPGIGESTLLASVTGVLDPATFSATSALGASVFMCELGETDNNFLTVGTSRNKTDLAPIKVADPKTNILDLFFYMSVTGQSNTFASYPVDLKVYRTAANATVHGGAVVGSGTGLVALPGNNGQPQLQHLKLTTPVTAVTTGSNALWFVVTMVSPPGGRTFQVWYTSLATNKLSTSCKSSFVKTGSTLRAGAAVLLKN